MEISVKYIVYKQFMVVSALLTTPYPLKIGWSQLKKQETLYPEKKVFLAIKHNNLQWKNVSKNNYFRS